MRAPTPKTAAMAAVLYAGYTAIVTVTFAVAEGSWPLHLISYNIPEATLLITTVVVIAAFWGSNQSRARRLAAIAVTALVLAPLLIEGFSIANDLSWSFGITWRVFATTLAVLVITYLGLLFFPKVRLVD